MDHCRRHSNCLRNKRDYPRICAKPLETYTNPHVIFFKLNETEDKVDRGRNATTFSRSKTDTISASEGSEAVPACPSGKVKR
jgi:hypothetical protein